MTRVRLVAIVVSSVALVGCWSAAPRAGSSGAVQVADDVSYVLDDGEQLHREFPDTFGIPSAKDRTNLKPGQIVKLMFRITAGKEELVERMWVIVARKDGSGFVGELDNQPTLTDKMRPGMPVRFEPRHVIDIYSKQVQPSKRQ